MNSAIATSSRPALSGVLLASAGAIAFSGKAILVKLSYRYGVDAVTVITYRMLFALPLFLALSWWSGRGKPALSGRDWGMLFALGCSGYYLASLLDFVGLQYVGASLERLILYLNPTIVLAVGLLVFNRKIARRQWLALAVSYAGVLVVFAHDIRVSGNQATFGALLIFGSAISYALYLVFSGEAVRRIGALRLSGNATAIACLLCIVQFLVLRPLSTLAVAPEVIWLAVLNATLCTFVPVLLTMVAVAQVGAGITSQAGMLGPVATIFLSAALLDEPVTIWMVCGTLLVLTGMWLLTRRT